MNKIETALKLISDNNWDNEENKEEEDVPRDAPSEEDIVISDSSGGGYNVKVVGGNYLGHFSSLIKAERAINNYMESHNFYPDVWFVNDHGNVSQYKLTDPYNEEKDIIQGIELYIEEHKDNTMWIYAEASLTDIYEEDYDELSVGHAYPSDTEAIGEGCRMELIDLEDYLKESKKVDMTNFESLAKDALERALRE